MRPPDPSGGRFTSHTGRGGMPTSTQIGWGLRCCLVWSIRERAGRKASTAAWRIRRARALPRFMCMTRAQGGSHAPGPPQRQLTIGAAGPAAVGALAVCAYALQLTEQRASKVRVRVKPAGAPHTSARFETQGWSVVTGNLRWASRIASSQLAPWRSRERHTASRRAVPTFVPSSVNRGARSQYLRCSFRR